VVTKDEKKFAREMNGIIKLMEQGSAHFHSFDCRPCVCQTRDEGSLEFKSFQAVEFVLKVRTNFELEGLPKTYAYKI